MNVNQPDTYWQRSSSSDDDRHLSGLPFLNRFHWADHQLVLHVLAALAITLMLVATTLMITKH